MGYIGNKPAQGLFDTQNIKDGGVQTADIADSAVTESKVADGSIQTSKIANGAVTAAKIADGAAVPSQTGQAGKYLTTDGTTASWDTVDLTPYATTTALANAVANASNWDTAYSWGDHSVQGYATTSALTAAVANSSNWDTAFGWGNHASVGYLVAADIVGKMNTSGGTFTGNVNFGDNNRAIFGAGSDLQIYHNGTNNRIESAQQLNIEAASGDVVIRGTDNIYLQGSTANETFLKADEDGAVTLYHNNSSKLATTSTGIDVTGTVTADGVSLGDNQKAQFGTGNDLLVYHDGTHSHILENGTGDLFIAGSDNITIRDASTDEKFIRCTKDADVELYYNGVEKLATTSTGVTVTGTVSATAFSGDGSGLTGIESFTKSASDPTVTTNGTLGDVWVNTTSGEVYVLTDATSNNNIWTNVGEGSGNIRPNVSAELLLIAGGGGGGSGPGEGGGGGAGGLLYYGSETPKTPNGPALSLVRGSTYSVVIGGGGTGASGYTSVTNSNGTNSSFTGVTTAVGGGRGGLYPDAGVGDGGSGGSGGGGGGNALSGGSQTGGSGTNGQGNAGGNGVARGNYGNGLYGAGGGGAGAAGTTPTSSPGNGGVGLQYAIQGNTYYYAGGGAGNTNGNDDGVGGTGGGGNVDTSGNANSGGGGGAGSASNGGSGGSGVAILKIPTVDYTGTTSGSPTVTTSGSYTIIKFTSSGSYTA